MDTKPLEEIGFTNGESKVYMALLDLGPSTTGQIIKLAEVSRSKVYEMLEKLIKEGVVSFSHLGKVVDITSIFAGIY